MRIAWYRYLLENMDWLEEELGDYDNDYLIFDCPGMSLGYFYALRLRLLKR